MPSVRRPRLPVRESWREPRQSRRHSSARRRLRPSRLHWESWCDGSITECIGQGLKIQARLLLLVFLAFMHGQWNHDLRKVVSGCL